MAKIIWSPSALDDIQAIADYIARDSIDSAALFIEKVLNATDRLEKHPRSGRVIPEIGEDIKREIIYGAYRIMYRVENDEVWITGIIHGARNWNHE